MMMTKETENLFVFGGNWKGVSLFDLALCSGILALICLFGTIYNFHDLPIASQSKDWPKTVGKIVLSTIQGCEIHRGKVRTVEGYRSELKYEYSVNNIGYAGETITVFAPHDSCREKIEEARSDLKPYPVNAATDVYYNPMNPRESALRVGNVSVQVVNSKIDSLYAAFLFFLIISMVLFLVVEFKKPRK